MMVYLYRFYFWYMSHFYRTLILIYEIRKDHHQKIQDKLKARIAKEDERIKKGFDERI